VKAVDSLQRSRPLRRVAARRKHLPICNSRQSVDLRQVIDLPVLLEKVTFAGSELLRDLFERTIERQELHGEFAAEGTSTKFLRPYRTALFTSDLRGRRMKRSVPQNAPSMARTTAVMIIRYATVT
jgi:hypothetical protein